MYFFNLNALVEHLKAEKNTTRESFQYLVGLYFMQMIGGSIKLVTGAKAQTGILSMNPTQGAIQVIGLIIGAGLAYWIITFIYRANGGDNGKHYLHRVIAIAFVLSCWTVPVVLVLSIPLFFFPGLIVLGLYILALLGIAVYVVLMTAAKLRYISGTGTNDTQLNPAPQT